MKYSEEMKPKKKKMGRPPMKDPRQGHIVIRVNNAESRAIRQAARAAGMRLGEYVRQKLLGDT
jgi:predicted HicB family RNase H-like nuclease